MKKTKELPLKCDKDKTVRAYSIFTRSHPGSKERHIVTYQESIYVKGPDDSLIRIASSNPATTIPETTWYEFGAEHNEGATPWYVRAEKSDYADGYKFQHIRLCDRTEYYRDLTELCE